MSSWTLTDINRYREAWITSTIAHGHEPLPKQWTNDLINLGLNPVKAPTFYNEWPTLAVRPITHDEATEALRRFENMFWKREPRPRISIPARPNETE